MGVGYDSLDRQALAARNVTVCNIPDYGTWEVADHAFGLILCLRRGIALYHETQRDDPPARWGRVESPLISRLQTSTLGILGLGRIGIAVAQRAKAFGCHVLFYDPHVRADVDRAIRIDRTHDLQDLFRRCDIVSIHCPGTRETRGLVGYELLSLMPRGSVLVNTARGEVVDLDGVERGLTEGVLSGAGLDVVPNEPIPDDNLHLLIQAYRAKEEWLTGRMVLSPHSAWHSPQSLVDVRTKTAETVRDVLIFGMKSNVIPPEQDWMDIGDLRARI
ncbi:hypothetical protein R6Q59_010209 [Mikania micrantha]